MEAIFLVCGAGGPQLKRNPLGRKREDHLRIMPLATIGQLWLATASAQQPSDTTSTARTIAVLEVTDQPFVRLLTNVHELNGLGIPGGLVDLRVLLPDDSAAIAAGQRAFVVLRPFSLPHNPIVFELPPIPHAMVHNTTGDNRQSTLVIEYSRGDTLVARRTVYVIDPRHIRVQEQAIGNHR